MGATIIQFPSGRKVSVTEPKPDADLADFDDWCEANVPTLQNEVGVLSTLWDAGELDLFWGQVEALRSLLNAWPTPGSTSD